MPTNDDGAPVSLRERRKIELARVVESAAMQLFTDEGYDNVSVGQICEATGISTSTFFRYFGSKDGVVVGIIDRVNDRVAAMLRDDTETDSFTEPYLRALDKEYRQAGYLDSAYMYRSVKIVVSPRVRAIYLDHLSDGHASMDREIVRRLPIALDGPELRSVRAILWISVDQAMQELRPSETLADLLARVRDNLALLARFERASS